LAVLVGYGVILFPSFLGINHHLLIYGSSPRWSYSVISGFGSSLGPWMWFKFYWAGWALLLAVAARLLWLRGAECDLRSKIATPLGAPAIHSSDGRRGRNSGDAHLLGGRLHPLQHGSVACVQPVADRDVDAVGPRCRAPTPSSGYVAYDEAG
jgi:hypothetical protein